MKAMNRKLSFKLAMICAILTITGMGGWQYFKHQQIKEIDQASNAYETLLSAAKQKDWKRAEVQARFIKDRYPKTSYAPLAALLLAKIDIEQNNNHGRAIENLQYAIKTGRKGHLSQIAALRLARVYISLEKYQEALEVLSPKSLEEAYRSLYEELKGDIYMKQNDLEKARAAYLTAIQSAPPGVPLSALQLKYADIQKDGIGE